MRTIALALSTLLLAAGLSAQESAKQPPAPDYSRPTLMRIFVVDPQLAAPEPVIEPEVGAVRIHSRALNLVLGYLPFYAPLPGSVPTTTREMVNPFVMTRMEIPSGPAAIARDRARELRRIQRLTRSAPAATTSTTATSATVKATP